jgi:GNAT superfamily N-acetyltransferase
MRKHGTELFKAHFDEIALNKECTTLDPDWDHYRKLEQAGVLFALGAWHDKKLVGYSATLLIPQHLHYRGLCYASNDVLFVAPEMRGGSLGARLMRETEDAARGRGASRIIWHAKKGSALDRVLSHREIYSVQDILYSRLL